MKKPEEEKKGMRQRKGGGNHENGVLFIVYRYNKI
jgi:hypothetical protein